MKTRAIILSGAFLLLIAGCGEEKETFTRYPSVAVPEYQPKEYIRDLSDPNPELVYNAICNLGGAAGSFSKTLCATNAEPDSVKYKTAEEAYRTICGKLESEDPLTVAASLRFLQLFAKNYQPAEELVEIACRVESDHPQVQFEQANLLKRVIREDTRLPEPLLRRLLDSPSWIVSRTAYDLTGMLKDKPLRTELVQHYQESKNERDRLLMLQALGYRLEPEEARFLEEEMLATESPKIRHAAVWVLLQNIECPGVKPWFLSHYSKFSNKEKSWIFEECDDVDLACYFVAQGFTPKDKFLNCLLHAIQEEGESEDRAEMLRFEEAVMAAPHLVERWQNMKLEAEKEHQRKIALRDEMAPVSQQFLETTKAMLTKHGTSAEEQEKIIKKISKTLKPYMKE